MMKENEHSYLKLLNILVNVIEAGKGTPAGEDDRMLDAEGLGLKFFGHVSSALYIYRGTNIHDINLPLNSFNDFTSLNIIARAAFETFLVFHHIYISPSTDGEKDFKYYSWLLSGLVPRQKFYTTSQESKDLLKREGDYIDFIITKLNDNKYFKALEKKQQNKITKSGYWRLKSWKEIALSAGLHEIHAKSLYSYLSDYAHSGSLSILQWREARSNDIRKRLMYATLGLILIVMANFIDCYCRVFPRALDNIKKSNVDISEVKIWIEAGAKS